MLAILRPLQTFQLNIAVTCLYLLSLRARRLLSLLPLLQLLALLLLRRLLLLLTCLRHDAALALRLLGRVRFGARLHLRRSLCALAVFYVLRLARLGVDNDEARAPLQVADLRAARNIFCVGRLGDEVRHDGVARGGWLFADGGDHITAIGREREARDRLTRR